MFNRKIRELKDQVEDLQRRVINLEQGVIYTRYTSFSYQPFILGSVKTVLSRILEHLGLTMEWHPGTEGYLTLEKPQNTKAINQK